jgi:hypothetical protein
MKALLNFWITRLPALLRDLGPYAAIELLLPGGSVIALLFWLCRHRATVATMIPKHPAFVSIQYHSLSYATVPTDDSRSDYPPPSYFLTSDLGATSRHARSMRSGNTSGSTVENRTRIQG